MFNQINHTYNFFLNQSLSPNGSYDYCIHFPEDPVCSYEPFKLTTGKIISAVIIALLMIIALGGNVLLCTAFLFYRRLRKTTNYFIISLAVSDILVAAVAMPMWISYEITAWTTLPLWIDFHMMYKFWLWLDILSGVSSITNLAGISIDRFFSIMAPLLHRTRMTSSLAIMMIALAWIYSIILASLSFAEWHYFTLIIAVTGFFLPLSIIVASYIAIYCKVKHGFINKHSDKDWNLERTLLIVIFVFIVCWLPFFVFSLFYNYCRECHFEPKSLHHIVSFVKWMHYLNSCFNPFIYGFFNTNFKMAFKALLSQCFGRETVDRDFTHAPGDTRDSTIISHIRHIGRKLRYSHRSSKNGLLLTEAESGVTMLSTAPSSNRNSNVLNNNPCGIHLLSEEMEQVNTAETENGRDHRETSNGLKEYNESHKIHRKCNGDVISDTIGDTDDVIDWNAVGKPRDHDKNDMQNLHFLNSQESDV